MQYEQGMEEREYRAKAWGLEEWLVNSDLYCAKLLWISPNWMCSLHYHPKKSETMICIDGLVRVEYYLPDGARRDTILIGWRRDVINLPTGTPHRFWAMEDEGGLLLEVSTHHDDEDVVRLEPSQPFLSDKEKQPNAR